MSPSRRMFLKAAPALALPSLSPAQNGPKLARIRLAVSTYSYWHFRGERYPVEKVIEMPPAWVSTASRSCIARWPKNHLLI